MSRERWLSWASPAFGAIRPIGSWWATGNYSERMIRQSAPSGWTRGCERFGDKIMRHLLFKAQPDAKPDSTFAGRACENPNLSISRASYKRALVPGGAQGPCRCRFPLLQAPRAMNFAEFSEDSHAAKPPCAG